MSATDELRRMLDERGVEWWNASPRKTKWNSPVLGGPVAVSEWNGKMVLDAGYVNVTPEQAIAATLGQAVTGETSDGYHTFNELYHHRAVLFSVVVRDHQELAWKSKRHHDGTMYDNMFIVGIETPKGQATYHYDIDPYWEMFDCRELERAPEWDGHTPDEAIARIATLGVSDATATRQGAADLKAENAKLEELVRSYESLTAALCNERGCAGCPFDSTAHVLCEHMRLAACMGELGIEVD